METFLKKLLSSREVCTLQWNLCNFFAKSLQVKNYAQFEKTFLGADLEKLLSKMSFPDKNSTINNAWQ